MTITVLNQLANAAIRRLVDENENRYCSVVFLKKDGTLRRMLVHNAQRKFHVKGTELGQRMAASRAANNPNLITAWDASKRAFRSFHVDQVLSVRAGGKLYRFRTLAGLPIDHDAIPLPPRVAS